MKRKELTGIIGCFALLLIANVIACRSPGQALNGQNANSMSYTKLDSSGNALPVSAPSWVMVKDNVTGLIWENKTDDGTIHDKANKYTWYDSNPATNGGHVGFLGNGTNTKAFINALNNAHFGGYSDWRLPTVKELSSIVKSDIPNPGPTINADYFSNTQPGNYWSSTTYEREAHPDYAYVVNFNGRDGINDKSNSYHVRAVRGGQ